MFFSLFSLSFYILFTFYLQLFFLFSIKIYLKNRKMMWKHQKREKNKISTSQQRAEHLFAGWNIQHTGIRVLNFQTKLGKKNKSIQITKSIRLQIRFWIDIYVTSQSESGIQILMTSLVCPVFNWKQSIEPTHNLNMR
jgi:hypothetical protein